MHPTLVQMWPTVSAGVAAWLMIRMGERRGVAVLRLPARDVDASVIVVGSRGLTGLREALERSVSHAVAAHAQRRVLVVPPSLR